MAIATHSSDTPRHTEAIPSKFGLRFLDLIGLVASVGIMLGPLVAMVIYRGTY